MKNSSDPACPPVGVTYTITGTGELVIFSMISRVELTSPPGYSSRSTQLAHWCAPPDQLRVKCIPSDGLDRVVHHDFDNLTPRRRSAERNPQNANDNSN